MFARLVETGLNPAFAVLFLRSQNLPHQAGLAFLVLCVYVRILAWFPAGAARHLFWLTHDRILLQPAVFGSIPSQIHRLARPPDHVPSMRATSRADRREQARYSSRSATWKL
jgi:hypothetical protein